MVPHFRGVVWPHGQKEGLYKYIVIGVLASEEPIAEYEGRDEVPLAGRAWGLKDALTAIPEGERVHKTGDAVDLLTSLGTCIVEKTEDSA